MHDDLQLKRLQDVHEAPIERLERVEVLDETRLWVPRLAGVRCKVRPEARVAQHLEHLRCAVKRSVIVAPSRQQDDDDLVERERAEWCAGHHLEHVQLDASALLARTAPPQVACVRASTVLPSLEDACTSTRAKCHFDKQKAQLTARPERDPQMEKTFPQIQTTIQRRVPEMTGAPILSLHFVLYRVVSDYDLCENELY